MVMHLRKDRWPSAWQTEITFRQAGRMLIEIRNVSETGMRCLVERPVSPGEQARLQIMDRVVQARVVRTGRNEAALAFDTPLTAPQLATLRQFRRVASRGLG